MKKIRKIFSVALVFALLVVAKLLSDTSLVEAGTSPKMNKLADSVYIEHGTTLSVSGAKGKVKWRTSDRHVAEVSGHGDFALVRGVKRGTAIISANVDGKTLKCKITVVNPRLRVHGSYIYSTGTVLRLSLPCSFSSVRWKVSNGRVDMFGRSTEGCSLAGRYHGLVTVTASFSNGYKTSVKIRVLDPKFAKSSYTVRVGSEKKMTFGKIGDAKIKNVTFSKGKGYVSFIDWVTVEDRKNRTKTIGVKGLKKGTGTVTVYLDNGVKLSTKLTIK